MRGNHLPYAATQGINERKKRNGKIAEEYSRDRTALVNKKSIDPALETRQSCTIEYRVSKIVPRDTERGIKVLLYC